MPTASPQYCIYDVQAQAGTSAGWFGGEKRFAHAALNSLVHPAPSVGDLQYDISAAGHVHVLITTQFHVNRESANRQATASGHCVSGIRAKIKDHLAERSSFPEDLLKLAVQL
jgi:hypothetical protein